MLNKNYEYIILRNGLEYTILDKARKGVITLQYGKLTDITKDCLKLHKKDNKANKISNLYIGNQWYSYVNGIINSNSMTTYDSDIQITTDDRQELDKEIFKLQREQIERMLKRNKECMEALNKGKQYYTYTFNNVDNL